ncbi:GDSL esterase/lipase At5g45960 [Telopea speciosissima]|uniref:GDSL esterase/lipase At5g45960 n=1 Tax=Telopea speciosissima TaxID=54955 RepID=UPI001CC78B82|nr:GDSL esterase/lipase At5g45960 [Telopea speciosissima]
MSSSLDLLLVLLLLLLFLFVAQTQALLKPKNSNFSAIYVFGDSTVDPGNNNHIDTIFRSNFPPYGRDFPNQLPTGRFSDGRIPTDFIASYLGIKDYVPPYLDKSLSLEDLMTGVSFASAGSGYDPLTATLSNVIQMPTQLEYFKEYKTKIANSIGTNRTEDHIQNSIVVISCGTNDFVVNYFALPIRRQKYTTSASYQQFLLQNLREMIQGLWDLGIRRFAVTGLPPMGCLPEVITAGYEFLHFLHRDCVATYSLAAREYNKQLQDELVDIQNSMAFHSGIFVYGDIYTPLADMIQNPQNYGFEETSRGCCGSGLIEASFTCGPNTLVCPDATKYVFWDAVHPTERAYYFVTNSLHRIIDSFVKHLP